MRDNPGSNALLYVMDVGRTKLGINTTYGAGPEPWCRPFSRG